MGIILFDNKYLSFLPLTFTKPVAEIRMGILTNTERWKRMSSQNISYFSLPYLSEKFPTQIENSNVFVAGNIIPSYEFVEKVGLLKSSQALSYKGKIIAFACDKEVASGIVAKANNFLTNPIFENIISQSDVINLTAEINFLFDLFQKNKEVLMFDFQLLTKNRSSQKLSNTNTLIGENIFIEEGATVECSFLNAKEGPIYIGKNAEVMEGAMIRGGFSLGEGSIVKMGTKVYGATTVGLFCKIGGEVSNSILNNYTNKGHDGFLGNSILGDWCNLGADTNTSNLKNNYGNIKVWSYAGQNFVDTKLQFHGLVMGDHSKCGINTMFNTGTVVGVSANVFGGEFPLKFVPSFSWGGGENFATYNFEKACETAQAVMQRRGASLNLEDKKILQFVFEQEEKYRNNKPI